MPVPADSDRFDRPLVSVTKMSPFCAAVLTVSSSTLVTIALAFVPKLPLLTVTFALLALMSVALSRSDTDPVVTLSVTLPWPADSGQIRQPIGFRYVDIAILSRGANCEFIHAGGNSIGVCAEAAVADRNCRALGRDVGRVIEVNTEPVVTVSVTLPLAADRFQS